MDDFTYINGELHCESVPVQHIAADFGTPTYLYSAATLRGHYDRLAAAFAPLDPLICYSIKSCPNTHLCRLLAERGAGFDVVSGGELHRALLAGGDPKKIVFAGVGKTDAEIEAGIDAGIGWFNIESKPELENMARIAASKGKQVRAALRINPDVDPHTHAYTTTGKKETKFGVDMTHARAIFADHFASQSTIRNPQSAILLRGLHLHLGSPVNTVQPYLDAIRKALALIDELTAAGHVIEMLDIGGGFGANYRGHESLLAADYAEQIVPLIQQWASIGVLPPLPSRERAGVRVLRPGTTPYNLKIVIEPGRSIAANAGLLLTKVLYVKESGDKRFIICDAGMNDLIRPALYQAYHFIWPTKPPANMIPAQRGENLVFAPSPFKGEGRGEGVSENNLLEYDIVGPVCETGDFFAQSRRLPPVQRGDLLAIFTAGAYGMSMTSNYNSRPKPAEILVEGNSPRLIRRRETHADMLATEE